MQWCLSDMSYDRHDSSDLALISHYCILIYIYACMLHPSNSTSDFVPDYNFSFTIRSFYYVKLIVESGGLT